MDRNTNGELTSEEREKLEGLVELSRTISLARAQAFTRPRAQTGMSARSELVSTVGEVGQPFNGS